MTDADLEFLTGLVEELRLAADVFSDAGYEHMPDQLFDMANEIEVALEDEA